MHGSFPRKNIDKGNSEVDKNISIHPAVSGDVIIKYKLFKNGS